MSAISTLVLGPVNAEDFKRLSASNLTPSLANRRAVGIKREIETLLEDPSSTLTLNDKVVIADRTISAFVQELTETRASFREQAEKIKTELKGFVQEKSRELFQKEKAAEAKKAKNAFEHFEKAIKASAEQKKAAYTEKLKPEDADVLSVVAEARQDISKIADYKIPNKNQEAAALSERIIQELTNDLSGKAITAQTKKVERAFETFLQNNQQRIDNAKKSLVETQQGWSQEASGKNPTVFIMELPQKPLEFQDAEAYERTRLGFERDLIAKELNALHQLKGLPEFSGNFSSSAALSNQPKASQSDLLFQKAEEARSLARTLETTKSAAVGYDLKKGEIDQSFEKNNESISSLEKALLEEEGPVTDEEILSLELQIVHNNQTTRNLLEDLEKLREAIVKGIPGVQLNNETKVLSGLLQLQESSYERLNEFKNAKTIFQKGNFEELNLSSFSYLKLDAPRNNPMFAMLSKIASEKMAVGDVQAARLYKANLEEMLDRIDNQKFREKFTIPELKKTWAEKVQEFFTNIFSSISNSFSSIKAWFISFFSKEDAPPVDHLSRRLSNASTVAHSISEVDSEEEEEEAIVETSSPRASQYYENIANKV